MAAKVTIFANGKARQVDPDKTVAAMIRELKLTPAAVLVERNGRALLRQEWENGCPLNPVLTSVFSWYRVRVRLFCRLPKSAI